MTVLHKPVACRQWHSQKFVMGGGGWLDNGSQAENMIPGCHSQKYVRILLDFCCILSVIYKRFFSKGVWGVTLEFLLQFMLFCLFYQLFLNVYFGKWVRDITTETLLQAFMRFEEFVGHLPLFFKDNLLMGDSWTPCLLQLRHCISDVIFRL